MKHRGGRFIAVSVRRYGDSRVQCVEVLSPSGLFSVKAYLPGTSTRAPVSQLVSQTRMTHCLSLGALGLFHVCIKFIRLTEEGSPEHTFQVQVLQCEAEKMRICDWKEGKKICFYRFYEPAQNT